MSEPTLSEVMELLKQVDAKLDQVLEYAAEPEEEEVRVDALTTAIQSMRQKRRDS